MFLDCKVLGLRPVHSLLNWFFLNRVSWQLIQQWESIDIRWAVSIGIRLVVSIDIGWEVSIDVGWAVSIDVGWAVSIDASLW